MPMEFPEELLDENTPDGTPQSEQVQNNIAPLYCPHGIRWSYKHPEGWTPDEITDAPGHDVPGQNAPPCQPATVKNMADDPQAQALLEVKEELLEENRRVI